MFLTAYFSSMDIGIAFSILYDSDFLCLLFLLLTNLFDDEGVLLIFYVLIKGGIGLGPESLAPVPLLWFIKCLSITCSIWNPGIC